MLDENLDLYQSLFENNHVIILLIEPETGNIIDANLTASLFYGWSREQLCNMKIWDINILSINEIKDEMLLAKARNKKIFNFQHRLSTGEIRYVEVSSGPITLNSQKLLYSIVHDITERRLAEEEVKQHAEFERTILSFAQDFINIPLEEIHDAIQNAMGKMAEYYQADEATVFRYDWENECAIQHNRWVSNSIYSSDEGWSLIPFKKIEIVLEYHKKGLLYPPSTINEVPNDFGFNHTAKQNQRQSLISIPLKNGAQVIGAFTLSSASEQSKWSDPDMSVIKIFCEMLTNVLQRMDQEKALREANENNRLILDSINDGISMLDRDGNILNINQTFAIRYSKSIADMIGINIKELLPEERFGSLYEQSMHRIRKIFETGQPEIFEDSRCGLCFYNRFYPVIKYGKISAVAIFSTDITERKAMEAKLYNTAEELTKKNKLITEFFTNISHEFKTPLAIILLQLELMNLYLDDEVKLKEIISTATQNSYRLSRLIGNILDITKIEAGYSKAYYETVDIVSLLQDICDSVEVYAREKSIQLSFNTLLSVKEMPIDIEKTERILLNLLSNAIKNTGKGGEIEVSAIDNEDGGVIISVEDTGVGIPEDKLETIFDRFAQVDTAFNRLNEGCGIGLALVKSKLDVLGGKISVKSQLGKGSKFVVELPLIDSSVEIKSAKGIGFELAKKVEIELSDL